MKKPSIIIGFYASFNSFVCFEVNEKWVEKIKS